MESREYCAYKNHTDNLVKQYNWRTWDSPGSQGLLKPFYEKYLWILIGINVQIAGFKFYLDRRKVCVSERLPDGTFSCRFSELMQDYCFPKY